MLEPCSRGPKHAILAARHRTGVSLGQATNTRSADWTTTGASHGAHPSPSEDPTHAPAPCALTNGTACCAGAERAPHLLDGKRTLARGVLGAQARAARRRCARARRWRRCRTGARSCSAAWTRAGATATTPTCSTRAGSTGSAWPASRAARRPSRARTTRAAPAAMPMINLTYTCPTPNLPKPRAYHMCGARRRARSPPHGASAPRLSRRRGDEGRSRPAACLTSKVF